MNTNNNNTPTTVGEYEVSKALNHLGIAASLLGYRYLRESILVVVENPDAAYAVTKVLYPRVAEKYSTTASRVERAIRHAIESAWSRSSFGAQNEMFGSTIDPMKGKPTNSEFIAQVADALLLESRRPKQ